MSSPFTILQRTVEWAATHTEFYRRYFDNSIPNIESIETFQQLIPVISKKDLVDDIDSFTDLSEKPTSIHITSGTTHQADKSQLLIFSSAMTERSSAKALTQVTLDSPNKTRIHLHLSNGAHGLVNKPVGEEITFVLPLAKKAQLQAIIQVLRKEFRFSNTESRVTWLSSGLHQLQILTAYLIESGVPSSEFAIDAIAASSYQLTSHWRSILEDYWKCPVVELYGLSEIPTFICQRLATNSPFQFNGPVFCEVLSLNGNDIATNGVGRLVVTPLLPFSATQPILRYDTGDLVRLSELAQDRPGLSFRLLGRASQCIVWNFGSGTRVLLEECTVQNILSLFPELDIVEYPFATSIGIRTKVGSPFQALSMNNNRLTLLVRLRFPVTEFKERAELIRKSVVDRVLESSPELMKAIKSNTVSFHVDFSN